MPEYWTPRITPYLLYEDVGKAWRWLEKAFGFTLRHPVPDGNGTHVELALGDDGVVMMGQPGSGYRNPHQLGCHTGYLYVRVTDVDRFFDTAVAAGAVVVEKPTDQPYGDRRCALDDPEGHRWYFAQSLGG